MNRTTSPSLTAVSRRTAGEGMIDLSRAQIDAALPGVEEGLRQYLWLQARVADGDFHRDTEFRRR